MANRKLAMAVAAVVLRCRLSTSTVKPAIAISAGFGGSGVVVGYQASPAVTVAKVLRGVGVIATSLKFRRMRPRLALVLVNKWW